MASPPVGKGSGRAQTAWRPGNVLDVHWWQGVGRVLDVHGWRGVLEGSGSRNAWEESVLCGMEGRGAKLQMPCGMLCRALKHAAPHARVTHLHTTFCPEVPC
eukprot:365381-Chlamydomonas_euryale.AAC.8